MSTAFARFIAAAIALLSIVAAPARAQSGDATPPTERLVDLPLANGHHQHALLVVPPQPKAVIIMLPGGAGDVGLTLNGDIRHDTNFVIRTRKLWIARGYAVLIPDTIDRANLRGLRSSSRYERVIGRLVTFADDAVAAPVFLLGTSQGAIAAMNGAARAPQGSLAGLILTEAVSVQGGSHETVFDAAPEDVRIPALVVANRDDKCRVAPPDMASKIAAAMHKSPDVKVITVSGGTVLSARDCDSLSPHGYYGIEDRVVGVISDWIEGHLAAQAKPPRG